ncbi:MULTISPECIES: hypothetical protein [unclassified Sphingobacterium]|jgi:hypothetical protein|uniref:hypothetical protein n=1 Tax=unclassified Sphingobacterium TaxID=2609468 RepID=UPI002952CA1F|nr:hypothetical protein [Sphingobacterium sp. UGAL515B_05]WON93739.1 hypothetical protein OK025_21130 [Sphingobacterium sp. UGAL515B_05]
MLQNRISPEGSFIKTTARGTWLGNRGVVHNEQKEIVKPYNIKAWIICMLEFKGRHREIMQPDRWTELFFLDEATAFSAGHRPCFQCRYRDHMRFKEYWIKGNPQFGFDMKTPIKEIDAIIHAERISPKGLKVTYPEQIKSLPDGLFINSNDGFYLLWKGRLYHWTPYGYDHSILAIPDQTVEILTPRSIVETVRAGYQLHIDKSVEK